MSRRKRSKWDWANALAKMLNHMLTGRGLSKSCPVCIDATIIRRLCNRQRGRCALSGVELSCPGVSELPKHTCLNSWRKKLERQNPSLYNCSPDLVRANSNLGWVPGNIILIAHMYYQLYNTVHSISGLKALCANLVEHDVIVPQAEALLPAPEKTPAVQESETTQDEHV